MSEHVGVSSFTTWFQREFRESKLTAGKMAKKLGISRASVSNYLTGKVVWPAVFAYSQIKKVYPDVPVPDRPLTAKGTLTKQEKDSGRVYKPVLQQQTRSNLIKLVYGMRKKLSRIEFKLDKLLGLCEVK